MMSSSNPNKQKFMSSCAVCANSAIHCVINISITLIFLAAFVDVGSSTTVSAPSPISATTVIGSPLYCVLEGHSPATHEPTLIPDEWINDDYCDCPFTGADEPNTSACSGAPLGLWAGITSDVDTLSKYYQPISDYICPQQPTKILSYSKLHDGQCDCCDGSDEKPGTCDDKCDEILAAERAEQQKRQESFNIGYQIRQTRLDEYKRRKATIEEEILDIETSKLPPLEDSVKLLEESISLAHEQNKIQRQQMLNNVITSMDSALSFISAMTNDELVEFIVSMCHLEGESNQLFNERRKDRNLYKNNIDVELDCITLMHVLNDELNIKCDMISNDMASCTRNNTDNDSSNKQINNNKNRRAKFYHNDDMLRNNPYDKYASRLISPLRISFYIHAQEILKRIHELYQELEKQSTEEEETNNINEDHAYDASGYDDDYHNRHPMDDDYNMGDHYYGGEDDDVIDEEAYEDTSSRRRLTTVRPPRAPAREQDRQQSKKGNKEDDSSRIDPKDDKSNPETSAPPTVSDEHKQQIDDKPLVDPLVLNLVKDQLSGRLRNLQRGGRYAQNGRAIMEAIVELLEEEEEESDNNNNDNINVAGISSTSWILRKLTVSLMEQSRVNDADVTEALYMLVHPNVRTNILQTLENTDGICGEDPGLPLCPPLPPVERTISITTDNSSQKILIPPESLIETLEERCKARFEGIEIYIPGTCAATELVNIPPDAPNGFHGYFDVTLRSSDSLLSRTFSSATGVSSSQADNGGASGGDNNLIVEKEKELSNIRNEIEKLQNDLKSKRDEIGVGESDVSSNNNKYGPDGILHSWKDTCLSVQAGKYTYEMCPFGKATQREGRGGGGTSLGTYQSIQFDNNTKTYFLQFSKGQKCWNGPQRSIKVYLTCGASDELLSAEEPETCVYHVHGVSPLMCDIHYATRHNLTIPSK